MGVATAGGAAHPCANRYRRKERRGNPGKLHRGPPKEGALLQPAHLACQGKVPPRQRKKGTASAVVTGSVAARSGAPCAGVRPVVPASCCPRRVLDSVAPELAQLGW